MRGEVNQYFFIFGAIVVALFMLAAFVSFDRLFNFEDAKQTVSIDSMEVLLESMDVHRGEYVSGFVTLEEPMVFDGKNRTIGIIDGPKRQLVLRDEVVPEEAIFEGTVRIRAEVFPESASSIQFSVFQEPSCTPTPMELSELESRTDIRLVKKHGSALDDPQTVVLLASDSARYCEFIGLNENYPLQAYVSSNVDRFTDTGVMIVVS